jgi:HAD superfamily hydrolase (TIGR01509 family)
MTRPDALVFDFGQVLIDLDMDRAKGSFAALGIPDLDAMFSLLKADPLFIGLEVGEVDASSFHASVREMSGTDVSGKAIDEAWNSLLADYRVESLRFVDRLRQRMPVYLYSNTNAIHYEAFQRTLRETTPYRRLEDLFTRAYFSHTMGMRKPGPEGYLHIIAENGLDPARTLFVDDHPDNIRGAADVGLQTHRLLAGERVETLLAHLLEG